MLYSVVEKMFGRRLLMRVGRFLFLGARRELVNSPDLNGEYVLLRAVCSYMATTKGDKRHHCFDVGANLGDWTAELLKHAGSTNLLVYPFEPAPAQYGHITNRLSEAISKGEVVQQRAALAAKPGTTEFLVTGDDSGNNAIATSDSVVQGKSITVTLDTIDNFCADHGIADLTLVKVDTEGNDFNVIAGAARMLATGHIGVLQFEYNWRWVAFGHALREVFVAVEDLDYIVAQITQSGLEVHHAWHPELERFSETNFALVRRDMVQFLPHRHVAYDEANAIVAA